MKKILITAAIFLFLAVTPVFAHHPAADVVSEDVYEKIDAAVSQTPHVDMVQTFADEMTGTEPMRTYYFKSLGTKTNRLVMFILDHAAILEGNVEISIVYEDEDEDEDSKVLTQNDEDPSGSTNTWNVWGRPFFLNIFQTLP